MAVKVGELYGELRLDDEMTKQLARAEQSFKSTAKGLDADAKLGLDVSGVDDGASEGGAKIDDMISGWAAGGALAAAGVGVAIGAALVGGITGVIERGRETDRVAAALGLDPTQADRVGRLAGQIYADAWGSSFGEVAGAVEGVLSTVDWASLMSDEAITSATTKALEFAQMFDTDVSEALLGAGTLVKSGLARDFTEGFDLMVAALQRTSPKMRGELLDVLTEGEYVKFFEELGYSGEEAMGALVKASAGGTFALDKTGDAVKEFRIRATDMSEATGAAYFALGMDQKKMTEELLAGGPRAREAFDQIIGAVLGMQDPVAQNATALALFGTQFEDLGDIDALAAIAPMTGALGTVSGAADAASTTLNDNLGTKVDSILRKLSPENLLAVLESDGWEGVKANIGTAVDEIGALWDEYQPAVKQAIDEAYQGAKTWWDENGQGVLDDIGLWWDETARPWLADAIGAALSEAFDMAMTEFGTKVAEKFTQLTNPFTAGMLGFETFTGIDIPGFHAGGIVPGGPSTESLAVLRGGERIFTPTQDGYAPQGAGGGFTIGALQVYGAEPEMTARRTAAELRRLAYLRGVG
jgi:phage-related minor tail protein